MIATQRGGAVRDAALSEPESEGPPYDWADLLARRNALGLRTEDLATVLRVDLSKYWGRESGARSAGAGLVDELIDMEGFVAEQEQLLLDTVAGAQPGETIVLRALTAAEFASGHPQARTFRDGVSYPASLHDVAVGRAAAELTRQGYNVEVHRGDRRADLTVRRLAVGLLKEETGILFGMTKKKYYLQETGKADPPAGLVSELQAIDDFITATAAHLDVEEVDGVPVVLMIDDREQFELTYPQAKTRRDNRAYPLRVHRVAAGRRAGMIERATGAARIEVR